ncbi:imidazole glycerol phosphate synthase subunit HisH [Thauera linaloolentis]|uniref:Imidazole glycerol phosphate synthase subunit HisH n=1 Tax=Thauera linaloolentis (strain DSM 12138 / JCM 21573 / CCUG 41526 / CIP 105981 / IAM 15112 / NBRC 102519 / 47Lol) TaxID=1123367 RepID=N6YCJ3_THAL4|nr:imidazole glycerol phosphate synthase subunit HisH [Thauera linaloolentis]ENO89240.1 imidazole glycerol phosphate synthase subunit HisH [Thauera linaloolentis 47Lol = DSM 12138]MCM8564279.1 imidazole glycerol phosphate synthase subunit HisH [Thauera linaloolentis]
MTTVAIIDYGMGNLRSVAKAIEHVAPGHQVFATSDPARVAAAERVVFPGQGAMPDCMRELDGRGLRQAVLDAAASKPFLGICIGQQMLFEHSAEGDVPGLGILSGEVLRFPEQKMLLADGCRLKVPHMGWNEVWQREPHPMWEGIPDGERFYFVHSYFVVPADAALAAADTDYGVRFTSAVARDNIFAAQFHPEKSAAAGLRLLANFIRWQP